jgi:hypothetical protein
MALSMPPVLPARGWRRPRLLIALDNGLPVRLHKEDLILAAQGPEAVELGEQLVEIGALPDVRHQGDPLEAARVAIAQLGKAADEGHGHVVHTVKIQILQDVRDAALPAPDRPDMIKNSIG